MIAGFDWPFPCVWWHRRRASTSAILYGLGDTVFDRHEGVFHRPSYSNPFRGDRQRLLLPFVASSLPDQQARTTRPFTFTFDADAFLDPGVGDVLTFTATGAAGSPLPAWLGFEPLTRAFSGTPGVGDVGVLEIVVTARDSGGLGVSDTFVVTVLPGNSWHNQSNPYDVNGDGEVTPMDVLDLINYLNAHGTGPLPSTPEPPPYLDVNNDGDITPTDVLAMINYLNAKVRNGEGEAGGRMSVGTTADVGPAMPQAAWFPVAAVTDGTPARRWR